MTEYLLAAAAIVGLIVGSIAVHLFDDGRYASLQGQYAAYQLKATQDKATAVAAVNASLVAYQGQLKDAHDKLDQAQAQLDAAASTPVTHLVCRQAPQAGGVSAVPVFTKGGSPTPGTAGDVRQSDFDPSTALRRLSVGYERRVNGYRDALNQWPKETP